MATFALIHGGGDVGWYWHLVERELRERGHDTVAPDLPCDDDTAGLREYTDTVVAAIGDRADDLVVVGTSYGGFTAPLVADRRPALRGARSSRRAGRPSRRLCEHDGGRAVSVGGEGVEVEVSQLRAGGDAELGERLVQVVADRAGAEEQLRGDLLVRAALSDESNDLHLLGCEWRAGTVLRPDRPPGGAQFAPGAGGPWAGAEALEDLERGRELWTGVGAAACPS